MLKYRLRYNETAKWLTGFSLHAGISVGQMVSSEAEGDNFYSKNDKRYYNQTDVTLLAGLGYNFNEHFSFLFRYSNSVIPVFKENPGVTHSRSAFNVGNTLVLHFMLQYMFGKKMNGSNNENNTE